MKTRLSKQAAVRPFANDRVDVRAQGKASAERRLRRKSWPLRHAALLSVMAVVVLLAVIRLRVADLPLERDEGEYAYAGQLILQGIPPYQLAYNMKFPGTYYAYSMILALFGQTPWAIHVGLLILNGGTTIVLFFLGRKLVGIFAAAVGASAFAVMTLDHGIMGVFGHATHFVLLPALGGLLVLLRAIESKRPVGCVVAGALLGTAVLMKQQSIFFALFAAALLWWHERAQPTGRWLQLLLRWSLLAAGAAVPFAALCALFVAQGVLGRFWFWAFQYAIQYVSEVGLSHAWPRLAYAWLDL